MKSPRNLIGPAVRKLRYAKGLSQPQLAALAQRHGWDIGRDVIAKIETQTRWVSDAEIVALSKLLSVPIPKLCASPAEAFQHLRIASKR